MGKTLTKGVSCLLSYGRQGFDNKGHQDDYNCFTIVANTQTARHSCSTSCTTASSQGEATAVKGIESVKAHASVPGLPSWWSTAEQTTSSMVHGKHCDRCCSARQVAGRNGHQANMNFSYQGRGH